MLSFFFTQKKEATANLTNAKIIETDFNNEPCTKITLKTGSTVPYEILKTNSHPNIVPILKLSKNSIYTKKMDPLSFCIEKDKKLYCKYIIMKIKEAVDFVHKNLNREHRGVFIDSIFIEESGEPVLAGFERSCVLVETAGDYEKLNSLSVELTGLSIDQLCTGESAVENENSFESESLEEEITEKINIENSENLEMEQLKMVLKINSTFISTLKIDEKKELLIKLSSAKKIIPLVSVKNIFNVFIEELDKDNPNDYKTFVLESLIKINKEYFFKIKKTLFSVLNSTVRLFILQLFQKNSSNSIPLDDIAKDLSIGLRVKEKVMKTQTIEFIFNNEFSTDSMNYLLENMLSCNDSTSIALICSYLLKLERQDVYPPVYSLLFNFLQTEKCSSLVCKCLEKHFIHFDKVKLTEEILPQLCSRLSYGEDQEKFFLLLEKILKFLKDHKEEIQSNKLSLKSISSIFTRKDEPKDKIEELVAKMAQNK